MEVESRRFYEKAAARAQDPHIRQLLDDLAQEERSHEDRAEKLEEKSSAPPPSRRRTQPAAALRPADCAPGLAG